MGKKITPILLAVMAVVTGLIAVSPGGICIDAATGSSMESSCTPTYPFWYLGVVGIAAAGTAIWLWRRPKK